MYARKSDPSSASTVHTCSNHTRHAISIAQALLPSTLANPHTYTYTRPLHIAPYPRIPDRSMSHTYTYTRPLHVRCRHRYTCTHRIHTHHGGSSDKRERAQDGRNGLDGHSLLLYGIRRMEEEERTYVPANICTKTHMYHTRGLLIVLAAEDIHSSYRREEHAMRHLSVIVIGAEAPKVPEYGTVWYICALAHTSRSLSLARRLLLIFGRAWEGHVLNICVA